MMTTMTLFLGKSIETFMLVNMSLFQTGVPETHVGFIFLEKQGFSGKGKSILDIGSNRGDFLFFLVNELFNAEQIIGVEPANINDFGVKNYQLIF